MLWLVLSLVLAAFAEEIFWAGILSVPKGQWEAARSTGLASSRTLAYVVLPQAVRLDRAAAHQPHHRHHQEHRARHGDRRAAKSSTRPPPRQSFSGNATPLMMGAHRLIVLFIPVVALGRLLETRFAWRRA